ncbi:MAG: hypothetical protein PHS53_04315 [Candidatus Pacebacteria bacterium]|nr:hypothetical protein [Candidatus Paceibacterota bacterium]MDD5357343.1 hypothetical protein [Candidatus Paceibacterota bacterium]
MKKINLLKAGATAMTVLAVAFPVFASAATYAYVNQAGEVSTVTAADPWTAIQMAPNIDEHSGVMLLVNPADGLVGDRVTVS